MTITRVAIDIGSGDTRITCAQVDSLRNSIIAKSFERVVTIGLRKALAVGQDNTLSDDIQNVLIQALQSLLAEVNDHAPTQFSAVATSVFRTANNGEQVLERIRNTTRLSPFLLSHTEEAELGFTTAVIASGRARQEIIAWDSGSGSFQITMSEGQELAVYGAEFGYVSALTELFTLRGSKGVLTSPNPVSLREAINLCESIKDKLPEPCPFDNTKMVIGIGSNKSIFAVGKKAAGKDTFTLDEVWEAITGLCDKNDDELMGFVVPSEAVVRLLFLYSVMSHCKIAQVAYCPTNGNCEGMLLSPRYWLLL